MLAALLSLKAFCAEQHDLHLQIQSDNTCAVAYINNMGGTKSQHCNDIAIEMWLWCIKRNMWLSATHIPGVENLADSLSRDLNDNTEWMLDRETFITLFQKLSWCKMFIFHSCLAALVKYLHFPPLDEHICHIRCKI